MKVYESVKIYSTKPLNGRFLYQDCFQLIPSKIKMKKYFPVLLQIAIKPPKPYYRGSTNNSDTLSQTIIEILQLLSLFTQFYFFDWTKSKKTIKRFSRYQYPTIKRGKIRWYQDKSLDDRNVSEIVVPSNIEKWLDKYFKLEKAKKLIFRKSLYLYYSGISLKVSHPSHSFLSFVSSIETLCQDEFKKENKKIVEYCGQCHTIKESPWKCKKCERPIWGIGEKFREFIYKYGFNNVKSDSNIKFVNKIYNTRSKITHFGQLLDIDLFYDHETHRLHNWEQSFLHKDLIGITRVCLINWLVTNY